MQISMNQGTGLSERNWLTEGCHLCAWKMMDPICKLPYPTAPPTPPHPPSPSPMVIKQGRKPVTFLENNKWSGKIGTLLAISPDCQGAREGPVRFRSWQDWLPSWTLFFIFLSFAILFSMDVYKMKAIYVNLQNLHTSAAFKIFDFVHQIRRSTVPFHQRHGRAWFDRRQQLPGDEQTDAMWYACLARWNEIDLCFIYGTSHLL